MVVELSSAASRSSSSITRASRSRSAARSFATCLAAFAVFMSATEIPHDHFGDARPGLAVPQRRDPPRRRAPAEADTDGATGAPDAPSAVGAVGAVGQGLAGGGHELAERHQPVG